MVLVRLNEDKTGWVEINQKDKQEGDLYIDGYLKTKLDFAKTQQKRDYDVGGVIVGDEGSGKSTHASNVMLYMTNGKFRPTQHIIKDHEEALLVLEKVEDGGAIMFDEGYLLFYSADVLTKNQKQITKIFSIIRQKNLFFLIVAPSFFRLSTYFAVDRTRFLMRVYNSRSGDRGFFEYWGHKGKNKLFNVGKRFHRYSHSKFRGRFTKCSMLDEEYSKIKRDTLKKAFAEAHANRPKTPAAIRQETRKETIQKIIAANLDKTNKELAKILDFGSTETARRWRNEVLGKENNTIQLPVSA